MARRLRDPPFVRHLDLVLACASLAACTTGGATSASTAALAEADGPMSVVAERDDMRLLRGPASHPADQTDERPTYAMRVEGRRAFAPNERVLAGALVAGGVVWVTQGFELVDGWGEVLDEHVVPELAVTDDGRTLAYPHAAGADAGVYVVEGGDGRWSVPRRVTTGLEVADRPLFSADRQLVVVGSVPSGIAGVWLVDLTQDEPPVPVTNSTLRTGRPFGDAFVPPPADHESMRIDGTVLIYDDGRGEQRVTLASEVSR